jgi:hypothetical protein
VTIEKDDELDELSNDPSKALAQLFKYARGIPNPVSIESAIAYFRETYPEVDPPPDIASIKESLAIVALELHPFDKPLATAFDKSGLDPTNPADWRRLLDLFCWAHFRPKRGRGAPALWSARRYWRLLQDEDRVRFDHPSFSNEDVYRTIVKRFNHYRRKDGRPLTSGRIKTALREARDPECNPELAAQLRSWLQGTRSQCQQPQVNWSAEIEARFTRWFIEAYCKGIAAAWRRAENPVEY